MSEVATAEAVEEWPGAKQAQLMIGKSLRQLNRLADKGEIATAQGKDGRRRYCPEDLEVLKPTDEAAVLKIVLDLVDTLHKHTDKLLMNLDKPLTVLLDALSTEMQSQRDRNSTLEKTHLDMLTALETMTTDQTMREIAMSEHHKKQERKTEAFKLLKEELFPRILAGNKDGAAMVKVKELLDSFTEDQIEVFVESEFISKEQATSLRHLQTKKKPETEKET